MADPEPTDRRRPAAHGATFLLKHFSAPGKGKRRRLHAFDKARGGSYATTPDDATVRNTFTILTVTPSA